MEWANFLHIYQPPDQKEDTVRQIVGESYQKIIEVIKKNPAAKLTLNITACLAEQLLSLGYQDLLNEIKELVIRGQIELTESSKYHAFLPLLPDQEIERQIALNHETNLKIFGEHYKPKGFHLPEMAYSRRIANIVYKLGYSWIVLSEISYHGKLFGKVDSSKTYSLTGMPQFQVLFRNRKLSDLIQRGFMRDTAVFYDYLDKEIGPNDYIITAVDGETFGHHRPGLEKFLDDLYSENRIKTVTISEILSSYPKNGEIEPIESSWASMESELKEGTPFAQWKYPGNQIHDLQWQLTYLAIETVNSYKDDPNFSESRNFLDKALFSCQYWWAGAVPWWEVEYIEKGAFYLKHTIEILKTVSDEIKEKAQKLYSEIVTTAFDWERSGLAHEKSMTYTQKIIDELGEKIPKPSSIFSKR